MSSTAMKKSLLNQSKSSQRVVDSSGKADMNRGETPISTQSLQGERRSRCWIEDKGDHGNAINKKYSNESSESTFGTTDSCSTALSLRPSLLDPNKDAYDGDDSMTAEDDDGDEEVSHLIYLYVNITPDLLM